MLFGRFGMFFYLCKDFPLKNSLENIWWERKKYLPLQPQTRNKRSSQQQSGCLGSEIKERVL